MAEAQTQEPLSSTKGNKQDRQVVAVVEQEAHLKLQGVQALLSRKKKCRHSQAVPSALSFQPAVTQRWQLLEAEQMMQLAAQAVQVLVA